MVLFGRVCECVCLVAAVMWRGRGLGDNHRFEEGSHSELTHLIEPLGKNKARVMGLGRKAESVCAYVCVCVCGGGVPVHQQPWEWNLPCTQMTKRAISGARPA